MGQTGLKVQHTVGTPKPDKIKPFNLHISHWYKYRCFKLPSPPFSERRYCDARRHAVTMCVCPPH